MKEALLDELAARMRHACLSDIKYDLGTSALNDCIAGVPTGVYPLADWAECVRYLIPDAPDIADEAEARRRLAEAQPPAGHA